jgi:hypothetical protein
MSVRTYFCQLDIIAITVLRLAQLSGASEVRATSFGAWTPHAPSSSRRFVEGARHEDGTERFRAYLSVPVKKQHGSKVQCTVEEAMSTVGPVLFGLVSASHLQALSRGSKSGVRIWSLRSGRCLSHG